MKSLMSVVNNPPPLLDCPQIKSTLKDTRTSKSKGHSAESSWVSKKVLPESWERWISQVGKESVVKNPPASAGDMGLIPDLGSSPGEGNGNAAQYSCLKNP